MDNPLTHRDAETLWDRADERSRYAVVSSGIFGTMVHWRDIDSDIVHRKFCDQKKTVQNAIVEYYSDEDAE